MPKSVPPKCNPRSDNRPRIEFWGQVSERERERESENEIFLLPKNNRAILSHTLYDTILFVFLYKNERACDT